MSGILGRTNRSWPDTWYAPCVAPDPASNDALVDWLRSRQTVVDISSQPALWGNRLRSEEQLFLASSNRDIERATDETHAADLTQAHLIQMLSAIGREWIDIYCLTITKMPEEFQLNGALSVIESARQDGHIRHISLNVAGPPMASLALWQFRDAFELILCPSEAVSTFETLATDRRVGLIPVCDSSYQGSRLPKLVRTNQPL